MSKVNQPAINPYGSRFGYYAAHDAWLARGKANSFEAFRRDQCRRERLRLIKNGTIVPAYDMRPQMMAKDATGRWIAEIRYN